jgi:hypothetical protein
MMTESQVTEEVRRLATHLEIGNITENDLVVAFFHRLRDQDEAIIKLAFRQLPDGVHGLLHEYLQEFRENDYHDLSPFFQDGRTMEEREVFYIEMKPHFAVVVARLLELSS